MSFDILSWLAGRQQEAKQLLLFAASEFYLFF